MAWRSLLMLAVCCSMSSPAWAGEPSQPNFKGRITCVIVRYYVAKYTAAAAEAYARRNGASEADIASARHCLPPTITAQGG
jgi:hypothetical protein